MQRRENVRYLTLLVTGIFLTLTCCLQATPKELFTEKKLKTEEKSIFERDRKTEASQKARETASSTGIIQDDDTEAYAPPPGNSGNPQQITPVGNRDWICYILMAGSAILIAKRKKIRTLAD